MMLSFPLGVLSLLGWMLLAPAWPGDPGLGRAEVLRHSMLALMADKADPHFARPRFWAPFVVVGEGGGGGE